MAKDREDSLKQIVAVAKRRGFVFPGSDIYGGLSNTFDYGPFGIEILNNLKKLWWEYFVHRRDDVVGLDSSILLNPTVWEASGHVSNFSDPLMDCKQCKTRIRVDHFLEEKKGEGFCSGKTLTELLEVINQEKFPCPTCGTVGTFTEPRSFNLMFKTSHGASEDNSTDIYLRPETAQGIFINFKNILNSSRQKIPFGIAQIGKSFRNEIMARQFIFRTREFEQMEMEYFCAPGTQSEWFSFWVDYCMNWLTNVIGLKPSNLRIREHVKEELSFYSDRTADIEYQFPFGWGELWGIASRTDYDLKQHEKFSNVDLKYHDQTTNSKFLPYVVEPALGLNRLFLAVLSDAYEEQKLEKDETRTVLHLHPKVSPFKVAIFPLMKKDGLDTKAKEIYTLLRETWYVDYDDTAAIGKRYRRHDEIGTPYCITVDYDTLKDNTITIRERDSMLQERISIDSVPEFLVRKIR